MRQDPEVIMIGEIRDGETARVAVQAALTGHLIISTVHAPSAPEVLLRLLHLGIEPYLVASVVSLVVEQRLVRRLCACKRPTAPSPQPSPLAAEGSVRGREPFEAGNCEQCSGTGFKGRLLIADLLPMEGSVRAAVLQRQDS
jgi:general secretion pathway protein E